MTVLLTDDVWDDPIEEPTKGRVKKRAKRKSALRKNTFFLAESIKASSSVVGAHATVSDASKGQFRGQEVVKDIIDRDAP